jgi:hypothetical protein
MRDLDLIISALIGQNSASGGRIWRYDAMAQWDEKRKNKIAGLSGSHSRLTTECRGFSDVLLPKS